MRNPFEHPGETPVTFLCALAYVTLAFLTDPFAPTSESLFAYGMLRPVDVASGEPWRLLSYAFLHGGIVHLGFNTIALAFLGPMLERSLGSLRFAMLYIVAAIGGGIAVCLFRSPWQSVVGGSGALFGMMGAAVAMNMRSGRHLLSFLDFEGPRALLSLIGINLLLGWLLPMVSNTGHIGGLIAGFLVTFYFLQPPREAVTQAGIALRAAIAVLILGCAGYSIAPVARFDWLLQQWHEAAPGPRRDALRQAYSMSLSGAPDVWTDDTIMAAYYQRLLQIRDQYRQR